MHLVIISILCLMRINCTEFNICLHLKFLFLAAFCIDSVPFVDPESFMFSTYLISLEVSDGLVVRLIY